MLELVVCLLFVQRIDTVVHACNDAVRCQAHTLRMTHRGESWKPLLSFQSRAAKQHLSSRPQRAYAQVRCQTAPQKGYAWLHRKRTTRQQKPSACDQNYCTWNAAQYQLDRARAPATPIFVARHHKDGVSCCLQPTRQGLVGYNDNLSRSQRPAPNKTPCCRPS